MDFNKNSFSKGIDNESFSRDNDVTLTYVSSHKDGLHNDKTGFDTQKVDSNETNVITPGAKDDPFRTYRMSKQACLVVIWFTIGLYNGIAGPTLPDLRDRLGVSQEQISRVLMGRTLGFMFGAIIGGFLFRLLYRLSDTLMLLSLIVAALATGLMPWGSSLGMVVALYCIVGTAEGVTNAGGNTMVMHLWGDNAASPMNLLHFGFGVGALVVPQIARPFLSPDNSNESLIMIPYVPHRNEYIDESRIEIAYSIVTVLVLLVALMQLVVVIKGAPKDFPHWTPTGNWKSMASPGSCARGNIFYGIELLFLLLLYYASESGGARSYFEFLFSIVTEGNLQMPKSEAALLQSSFWLCFTFGRGISSPITAFIRVQVYLTIVLISMVFVSFIVAFFGSQVTIVMWICNCFLGYLMSVPFPNAMAWANLYLDMNSMATMILLIGNSFGGMAFQAWAGAVYDNQGPDAVLYLPAVGCSLLAIIFAVLQSIAYFQGGVFKESKVLTEKVIDEKDTESNL